ncbi:uncharacterized protein LOC136041598 [Artemia franciscana]|uniref:uncharacterized protein LOC136041598 n=1 Tax=Artemia franciscana TaxID=6661 RepID=UPI0032DBBA97
MRSVIERTDVSLLGRRLLKRQNSRKYGRMVEPSISPARRTMDGGGLMDEKAEYCNVKLTPDRRDVEHCIFSKDEQSSQAIFPNLMHQYKKGVSETPTSMRAGDKDSFIALKVKYLVEKIKDWRDIQGIFESVDSTGDEANSKREFKHIAGVTEDSHDC